MIVSTMIGIGVILMLPACSANESVPDASASAAILSEKSRTQAVVEDVIAQVPAAALRSSEQSPTGSLLPCAEGRQWAGHGKLELKSGVQIEKLFRAVQSADSLRSWRSEIDKNGAGEPRLRLAGTDDSAVLLSSRDGGTTVELSSFSRCIHLADDFLGSPSY